MLLHRPLLLALGTLALVGCRDAVEERARDLLARAPEAGGNIGAPQGAALEGGDLLIQPGGTAYYHLEAPSGGRLVLRGDRKLGELQVRSRTLDHDTLRVRDELEVDELRAEGNARVLRIPAAGSGLLQVEVALPGDASGDVRIDELVFLERDPLERLPVILISIDTLAARNLSLYGYARETSPNLDRFAEEAVVFEHCVSNATWTTPSYISLFSGLYNECFRRNAEDFKHDGKLPEEWKEWVLEESNWTLTESLRASGYRTAAFIDNLMGGPDFGMDQGFDEYDVQAANIHIFEQGGGIRNIVPRALAWLDGVDRTEPYFLFLQAIDVHGPYIPPPEFAGRFADDGHGLDPERVDQVMHLGKLFDSIPGLVARGPDGDPQAKLQDHMASAPFVDAYDEEILDLDDALGELFAGLRERGILDEAIVVVTADHGESMLGHGWYFNHGTCYEEVAHIPLVVRLPGGEDGGRRVDRRVQLVDLYPTLLEATGIAAGRSGFHGRSLVPLLEGRDLPDVPAYIEGGALENRAVYQGAWKLVEVRPAQGNWASLVTYAPARAWLAAEFPEEFPEGASSPNAAAYFVRDHPEKDGILRRMRKAFAEPIRELYDLSRDPLEEHDLSATEPERLRKMIELMEAERARIDAVKHLIEIREDPEMSPEMLEELRALGYGGNS